MTNILDNAFNDFFYESRIVSFVSKILTSSTSPQPINQMEVNLIKETEHLKKINEHYEGKLIQSLNNYSKFIQPKNAIIFLIETSHLNQIDAAKEIMDWAVKEKMTMDYDQLANAFKEKENMPLFFLPSFFGDLNEEGRIKKETPVKKSSIDFDKLKNFK